MEDQIPIKVFTYWSEYSNKTEVRRFSMDKCVVASYHNLTAKLEEIYPRLRGVLYSVYWIDEEGDDVVISSTDELLAALKAMQDIVKLHVCCRDEEPKEVYLDPVVTVDADNGTANENEKVEHYGVICDGCEVQIAGFRYKCTTCKDFDLCSKCEASGLHPEHCMVRLPIPNMPRFVIKSAIKRSRHFLKTLASSIDDAQYRKQRHEKLPERKRPIDGHGRHARPSGTGIQCPGLNGLGPQFVGPDGSVPQCIPINIPVPQCPLAGPPLGPGAHGPGPHVPGTYGHGPHGHKPHVRGHHRGNEQDRRHHRSSVSWLEILASYMNEFANLAGDVDFRTEKKPEAKSETPKQSEEHDAQTNQPQEAFSTSNQNPQYPFNPDNINADTLKTLLNCHLRNLNPPQPSTSSDGNQNQPPASSNVNQTKDLEMGQGDRKIPDDDKASVMSETSTTTESKKEDSPDKVDGWTVINKEKDLMDAYGRASAPAEISTPIGFNLSKEFQEHIVKSEGQKLYPPLNTATAELEPSTAQTAPAAQGAASAPPQPEAAVKTEPNSHKPEQPKAKPHPMAHIESALQNMIAMGFTNDGGWLTQLLESKNGNIAAVLDLLTPVNSRKN